MIFFVTFHCESTSIQTLVSVPPSIYVLKSTNHTKSKALFILAFQPERKTLDKMLLAHLVVWQVAYNLLMKLIDHHEVFNIIRRVLPETNRNVVPKVRI